MCSGWGGHEAQQRGSGIARVHLCHGLAVAIPHGTRGADTLNAHSSGGFVLGSQLRNASCGVCGRGRTSQARKDHESSPVLPGLFLPCISCNVLPFIPLTYPHCSSDISASSHLHPTCHHWSTQRYEQFVFVSRGLNIIPRQP